MENTAPLDAFVAAMRASTDLSVPNFDPRDGGVQARCLLLLEAPGDKAIASGYVSRDNPDQTARALRQACEAAGLAREDMILWNAIPWYTRRSPPAAERAAGRPYLDTLVGILTELRVIVCLGRVAERAAAHLAVTRIYAPHPSPVCLNRNPANRVRLHDALAQAARLLAAARTPSER
jgi:uracil-DNA glycosylase